MMQVDSAKRGSPSPSRASVRSEGRGRAPRVIRVNRDAATMAGGAGGAGGELSDPHLHPHPPHFRSRTFSDGFIGNTSLELLLGVDCEACLALAAQRHCHEHISEQDFDLVCNCNVQRNNYLNYRSDFGDQRGHTLNIYDLDRIKRQAHRGHFSTGSHRSLDRKFSKTKTIGVSNYISKQLIAYDPSNTLVQKIKRKLSNLKKMGGDAVSKKHQNAVQLAEITSGSTGSLKKLSMLSLVDRSQRKVGSQSCIFTSSSSFLSKDDFKNSVSTYENFSGNVDQCFDRLKECNISADMSGKGSQRLMKMRSFDNNDDIVNRGSPLQTMKFSTLDNRSRCRVIRRQMSYNDFPSDRFRDTRISEWDRDGGGCGAGEPSGVEARPCADAADVTMLDAHAAQTRCTCVSHQNTRIPSIFYDSQGKKRPVPAPDVTERGQAGPARGAACSACSACKPARWPSAGTASTTSHSSTTTGNTSRFSVWHRRWCLVAALVLVAGSACVAGPLALRAPPGAPLAERLRLAERLLHDTPLVDGHNDLPWNIRKFLHNRIKDFRFEEDLRTVSPWATSSWSHTDLPRLRAGRVAAQVGTVGCCRFEEDLRTVSPWATSSWSHTDLPRLRAGRVAAQFWAAYVPCDAQHRDAVQLTFEQIDLIQRLTDKYQPQLTLCTTAEDIIAAHANHRVCSLVGVEGGHAIGGSLGVLRTLFQVGVRYLTLTSTCDTPWAECASAPAGTGADRPEPARATAGGLTPFGKVVVKEMNRLGMLVDLSHVSERTMRAALAVSRAPVLFSHSAARALCNATRNVPDGVLRLLAANRGLVMVSFYTSFLTCRETATVQDAIAHINHIRDVAGVDSVGLGAGYDGINFTPQGLEDVSSYPLLFAELMEAGWSTEELRKLAGLNLLRVLGEAQRVARELAAGVQPYEDLPPRPPDLHNCSSQDL